MKIKLREDLQLAKADILSCSNVEALEVIESYGFEMKIFTGIADATKVFTYVTSSQVDSRRYCPTVVAGIQ